MFSSVSTASDAKNRSPVFPYLYHGAPISEDQIYDGCAFIGESYLDARPVYVQKKETIYGHFLICYLSLFLLRILEIKCFKNEINSYDLVNFICDFRVVDKGDGTYINISQNLSVNEKIKRLIGLTNLDALYLTEKEIENIFEFTMLTDS